MKKISKLIIVTLLLVGFVFSSLGFASTPIQSIKLNVSNIIVKANRTYSLKVTFVPSNTTQKSLVYSVANKKVATIDKSGVIKGVSAGKTYVLVKSASNSKIIAKCNVTVTPVQQIKLRFWMQNPASQYISSFNENESIQEMEKTTGIRMNFIHPSVAGLTEQFVLMIASNDLPDIISFYGPGSFFKQGLDRAIDDKIIIDLKPYLDKYAPNYKKLLDSDKTLYRSVVTNEKRIPAFYRVTVVKDPVSYAANINKNWLNDVNLQIPKTMDDWYAMLKTFKTVKKTDSPLASLTNGGALAFNGFAYFLGAFGIDKSFYPTKDLKTLAYGPIQPQMKEYLTVMNKWYKEGLIDKDYPTMTGQQITAKWANQKTGVMIHHAEIAYPLAVASNFDMVVAPYPVLKQGEKYNFLPDQNGINNETVITTANKYVLDTIKWFEYAYTEKGSILFNYGIEGKSYTMVDGKPKFTDYMLKNSKYPTPNQINILKLHALPQIFYNSESSPQVNQTTLNLRKIVNINADTSQTMPSIKVLSEDGANFNRIIAQVQVYQDEMLLKFLLGLEPIENFDKYVEQMKKLGIDEALKIQQRAYDKYLNK